MKTKMGRPKKFKRLERLSISLSKEEKESLSKLAKQSGSDSVSHYIRNLIKSLTHTV